MHDQTFRRFSAPVLVAIAFASWWGCGGTVQQEGSGSTSVDPLTIAETNEGPVQGIRDGDVIAFLGIPYAAPPLDELRWRAPAPPERRRGIHDASFARPECMQGSTANPKGSEDCLYLNVYRPVTSSAGKLPVLVWIHGGGYSIGSGIWWNLGPLAGAQGLVTVSVNYRLGAFGFLAHPA